MARCEYVNAAGQRCDGDAVVDCILPTETIPIELEHLCVEHAVLSGYCCMCGTFWAGVDSYDFIRIKGVCENCILEIESEDWTEDDDGGLTLDPYYDDEQYANDALDW